MYSALWCLRRRRRRRAENAAWTSTTFLLSLVAIIVSNDVACTSAFAASSYFTLGQVEQVYAHDQSIFTEGLALDEGILYESSGLWSHSSLSMQHLPSSPEEGSSPIATPPAAAHFPLDPHFFGEGIATWGPVLFQLTYREAIAFVYDRADLGRSQQRSYPPPWAPPHARLPAAPHPSTMHFIPSSSSSHASFAPALEPLPPRRTSVFEQRMTELLGAVRPKPRQRDPRIDAKFKSRSHRTSAAREGSETATGVGRGPFHLTPATSSSSFVELHTQVQELSQHRQQPPSFASSPSTHPQSTTGPHGVHSPPVYGRLREGWGLAAGPTREHLRVLYTAVHEQYIATNAAHRAAHRAAASAATTPSSRLRARPRSSLSFDTKRSAASLAARHPAALGSLAPLLYASDGSARLLVMDPERFQTVGELTVTGGPRHTPLPGLNELEYVLLPTSGSSASSFSSPSFSSSSSSSTSSPSPQDIPVPYEGELWANIVQTDCIARIDPVSGGVKGWVWTGGLHHGPHRAIRITNGIAFDLSQAVRGIARTAAAATATSTRSSNTSASSDVDAESGSTGPRVVITGKLWPVLFALRPGAVMDVLDHAALVSSHGADGMYTPGISNSEPALPLFQPPQSPLAATSQTPPAAEAASAAASSSTSTSTSSPSTTAAPPPSPPAAADVESLRDWRAWHLARVRRQVLAAAPEHIARRWGGEDPRSAAAFFTDPASPFFNANGGGLPRICEKHLATSDDLLFQRSLMNRGPVAAGAVGEGIFAGA